MSDRVPHILSTIKSTQCPSNLLFFDTETRDYLKGKGTNKEQHRLWFGYALAFRLENNERTRVKDCFFDTIEAFWSFVETRMDKGRPLYLYCHNASFDLTITDFWRVSEACQWDIDFAVLESPPVIISCTTDKGRLHVVDTVNYFKVPFAVLGDSLGLPKLEIDIATAKKEDAKVYCKRDVDIIATAIQSLMKFVRDNQLGKLGPTVASLAFSAYRHRFMTHEIFIHDRERVLELERASYHGGMVNCNYVGKVKKTMVYKLDVNSLYPTVMQYRYPTKLLYSLKNVSLSHLLTESKKYGILADVSIESEDYPYPIRHNKEFMMVTGKFRTVLIGPELFHAANYGRVKHLHYVSFYEMAPIFAEYVKFFWGLRAKYKELDDISGSTFCKYMLNSLYGKFAQGIYEWIPFTVYNTKNILETIGEVFPDVYSDPINLPTVGSGQIPWCPMGSKTTLKIRRVGSLEQIQQKSGWHANSFIAIASYVTSYARRYLMDLIDLAGKENVYYYDTDSLFTNDRGLSRLRKAKKLSSVQLGLLKEEGREWEPTFLAPKDYLFGEDVCLKGIRKKAQPICQHGKEWDKCTSCKGRPLSDRISYGRFKQVQFEGLPSVIKRGGSPYIEISTIEKQVTHKYKKGIINPDGSTRPFRFPEEA